MAEDAMGYKNNAYMKKGQTWGPRKHISVKSNKILTGY